MLFLLCVLTNVYWHASAVTVVTFSVCFRKKQNKTKKTSPWLAWGRKGKRGNWLWLSFVCVCVCVCVLGTSVEPWYIYTLNYLATLKCISYCIDEETEPKKEWEPCSGKWWNQERFTSLVELIQNLCWSPLYFLSLQLQSCIRELIPLPFFFFQYW